MGVWYPVSPMNPLYPLHFILKSQGLPLTPALGAVEEVQECLGLVASKTCPPLLKESF